MRVCPICEGYTATAVARCGTCDVPLVDVRAVTWPSRDEGGGSPWIGHVVGGKYRITGVLGRGGMGTVYRAVHELSHSPTAVKVLHTRFARQPSYRDTLMAEARRASRIRGDRIAQVLDVGETREGSIFVAMELVEGETLQHRLDRFGRLPPGELLVLLEETCLALEGLERGGVVHRDLSPSNLMLTRRGRELSVKLLDLGIAHLQEEPAEDSPARLWVNPPYTAPEVLRGERGNTRSDLYSLGVVAYQALGGRLPYGDGTTEERVRAVLDREPEPLRAPRGAPRALVDLIADLMRRDPERRPQGPEEVLARIRRIREPHGPRRRAGAFGLFVGGLLLFSVSFTRRPEALLEGRPGGITLSERPPGREEPYRPIQVEALEHQVFGARGVGPDDLVLRCLTADGRLRSFPLHGRLEGGELRFEARLDEGWRRFVDWAREVGGDMTLSFQLRGRDLAHAKLFLDRERPLLVGARLEGADDERALLARTWLAGRIVEDGHGGKVQAWIEVHDRDGELHGSVTLPLEASFRVALGAYFFNLPSLPEGGTLRIVLEDEAGRRSEPETRVLDRIDLSIPEITAILGVEGGTELLRSGESCEVRLRTNRGPLDDIAKVLVQADLGAEGLKLLPASFEVDGDSLRLHVLVPDELGDRRKLMLSFQLEDRAGNRSKPVDKQFDLHNLDLAPGFVVLPMTDHVPAHHMQGDAKKPFVLHWTEAGTMLRYLCNPDYEPWIEVGQLDLQVIDSAAGHCTLKLGEGLPEEITLGFQHRSWPDRRPQLRKTPLVLVRHGPGPGVTSRPEALSGERWTGELVQAGLLERVELQPDQVRLLLRAGLGLENGSGEGTEASLWRGVGEAWQRVGALSAEEPVVAPKRGRNRFALEVQDLLGREVVDRAGRVLPIQVDGHRLLPVLDFRHDDSPPRFPDALVEHGRDVRLRVELEQGFTEGTAVLLSPAWQGTEREEPIRIVLEAAGGGGTRGTAIVPFARVQRWCGLEGLPKEGFGEHAAVERRFRLETPAGTLGASPVAMRFQPTSSLLSARALRDIQADVPSSVVLVPFLGARTIELGVPRDRVRRLPGSLLVHHGLEVVGLSESYLGDREVTRAEYLAFVEAVVAGDLCKDAVAALGHREDPLGARRFTRAGLEPVCTIFDGATLASLAAAAPDRPVTGVDWFQASAYCRWLSWKVFGDPDHLRLPYACELVASAMQGLPAADGGFRLNGLRPRVEDLCEQRWKRVVRETVTDGRLDPARWPLLPEELRRLGDYTSGLGRPGEAAPVVTGIDFGVREWVEDLPFEDEEVAALIVGNHENHLATSQERREGRLRTELPRTVLRIGIVRGLGFGEPAVEGHDPLAEGWLDDAFAPEPQPARLGDPGLLGVRRSVQIARDGSTARTRRSLLAVVGFRVAGTARFLELARRTDQR